jgi:hypothetical protein
MKTSSKPLLLLLLAALLVLGCGTKAAEPEESAPTEPHAPPTKNAPPANGADPAGPAVQPAGVGAVVLDVGFELRGVVAGPYHAGQPGTFGVTLTPGAGYHVNEEYPIHVVVNAPSGLTLPKPALARADAAEFGPTKVRFEIPFTSDGAGDRQVGATVAFAVCTPDRCMPDERTLALVLPVVP